MIDRQRVVRIRGFLQDLGHVMAHGIALVVMCGTIRYVASSGIEKIMRDFDAELPAPTMLVLDAYHFLRAYWLLLPLMLIVDFGLMRLGRRWNGADHVAASYSVVVLLGIVLLMGTATVVLIHPWVDLMKRLN